MRVVTRISELQKLLDQARRQKKSIGFVPTMGYFHDGHITLMKVCRKKHDICVVSIFVNPKQFGPSEDFARYPRDKKNDEKLAKLANVDIIFYPSVDEIYPTGFQTYVDVEGLSDVLCGKTRPGHFKGVSTVVCKLLNIVRPTEMFLGQKDAQQVVILSKMIRDLNIPVKVKIVPTVREQDGLAMSSRNSYLSFQERQEASVLYQALQLAKNLIQLKERRACFICDQMKMLIQNHSRGVIDYIVCVDTKSLREVEEITTEVMFALAVRFNQTRLIDNLVIKSYGSTKKN